MEEQFLLRAEKWLKKTKRRWETEQIEQNQIGAMQMKC